MVSFTDDELRAIKNAAAPIWPVAERVRFLESVARAVMAIPALGSGIERSPQAVRQVIRAVQRQYLTTKVPA
jgi:hypothetical protein